MPKFIIKDDFWDIFPEAEISIVLAKGLDNSETGNANTRPDMIENLKKSCYVWTSTAFYK